MWAYTFQIGQQMVKAYIFFIIPQNHNPLLQNGLKSDHYRDLIQL